MSPLQSHTLILIHILIHSCISTYQWTQWYGYFTQQDNIPPGTTTYTFLASGYINQFCLRHIPFIQGIQAIASDGTESNYAGGDTGTYLCHTTNNGECYTGFLLCQGQFVNALIFNTSDGQSSPYWGDPCINTNSYIGLSNQCIFGYQVRTNNYLDQIRFYFSTTLPPTPNPTLRPSSSPSISPSNYPSQTTNYPSLTPSQTPTGVPSNYPSISPSEQPSQTTYNPSSSPSDLPSISPSINPSVSPSLMPSYNPSGTPTQFPTNLPTLSPSNRPTGTESIIMWILNSV